MTTFFIALSPAHKINYVNRAAGYVHFTQLKCESVVARADPLHPIKVLKYTLPGAKFSIYFKF